MPSLSGDSSDPTVAGVTGENSASTGVGVLGSTTTTGHGVVGEQGSNMNYTLGNYGVVGASESGDGVRGWAFNSGASGVSGENTAGIGVSGKGGSTPGSIGVLGTSNEVVSYETNQPHGVVGASGTGNGVRGESLDGPGVQGVTRSEFAAVQGTNAADGPGVVGDADSSDSYGVAGHNSGVGVLGASGKPLDNPQYQPGPHGVLGASNGGDGVRGLSWDQEHSGVHARNYGGGFGVYAETDGNDAAVRGQNVGSGAGLVGVSADGIGVLGNSNDPDTASVVGVKTGVDGPGVVGEGDSGPGVVGRSVGGGEGVKGEATAAGNGVFGENRDGEGYGVLGSSEQGVGVVGTSSNPDRPSVYGLKVGVGGPGAGVVGEGDSGPGVQGTSAGSTGVDGSSTSGTGVYGHSQSGWGIHGESPNNIGVRGVSTTTTGVDGASTSGTGMFGHSESGWGVHGESPNNIGVRGVTGAPGASGVSGENNAGGIGVAGHTDGPQPAVKGVNGSASVTRTLRGAGVWGETDDGVAAVFGHNTNPDGYGVYGDSDGIGVYGSNDAPTATVWYRSGVYGNSSAAKGPGVLGLSGWDSPVSYGADPILGNFRGEKIGVLGLCASGVGVYGITRTDSPPNEIRGSAVLGMNLATTGGGAGIAGHVFSAAGSAVYGAATDLVTGHPRGLAGNFIGDVSVSGRLTSNKAFKIDHPLDPSNKYLYHSSVESPNMMNVYNGNVTTDEEGQATVQLPEYFEALNRDFRYQLTAIGQFAQAIVEREIEGNSFSIRTDKPNVKVSWQVTGIRQDPYADAHRIPVEEDKPEEERGRYLHPEVYGEDPASRIGGVAPIPSTPTDTSPEGEIGPEGDVGDPFGLGMGGLAPEAEQPEGGAPPV